IQQIFQTCPERAAGQSSSEPTASWHIAYTAAGLIRTEHVGEPAFALQGAIREQSHESDHDRGHAAARITAQCVEHTSPPVRGERLWHSRAGLNVGATDDQAALSGSKKLHFTCGNCRLSSFSMALIASSFAVMLWFSCALTATMRS